MSGFAITQSKGFHITFANGYTVSVQFGGGNYGDNYYFPIGEEPKRSRMDSSEAETAVWGPDGKMLPWPPEDSNNVQGYRSPAQVLELLNWAAQQATT